MPYVLLDRRPPIAVVTLNEPEKRNPFSPALVTELTTGLQDLADDPGVRAVVITGAGPAFCAGADIRRLRVMTPLEDRAEYADILELNRLIWNYPKPTIAAVGGYALGAGCNLVTWCDLAVAGESASFGYPEVRLGIASATVVVTLLRSVGRKRMFELVLGAQPISATLAQEYGLVNRVVPDDQVIDEAVTWAEQLARYSPSAVAFTKEVVRNTLDMSYDQGLEYARDIRVLSRLNTDAFAELERYMASGRSRRVEER